MSTNPENRQEPPAAFLWPGAYANLDRTIEPGLFESTHGNRYLVSNGPKGKYAIALSHADLPRYSCYKLSNRPLDEGQWWGSAALYLYPASKKEMVPNVPGMIAIKDKHAILSCLTRAQSLTWVHLDAAPDEAPDGAHFNSWSVEAEDFQYPFFRRRPTGAVKLGSIRKKTPMIFRGDVSVELVPTPYRW